MIKKRECGSHLKNKVDGTDSGHFLNGIQILNYLKIYGIQTKMIYVKTVSP